MARTAILAGGAATAGLILAAALTATPDRPAPDPTPTGYRPPLSCDYARTASTCPTPPAVRRSAPNTPEHPRTAAPRPRSSTRR